MALSTQLKRIINSALAPIGLEVSTTLAKQQEIARLNHLGDNRHWERSRYSQGLSLNEAEGLNFLNTTCLPFKDRYMEFPQQQNGSKDEFYLQNGWFGAVDAEILYSLIRTLQPTQILEVGSGFSTRLMRKAITDGQLSTRITSVDPQPNTLIEPFADEYLRQPIEDIPLEEIVGMLRANDILFIDSSHKIKTGGDIPYLFLEVLPRLRDGVYIHVHDIFLPFDYPQQWVIDGWDWNEQYLVHAFLCYNELFKIRWSSSFMWHICRDEITNIIPAASFLKAPPGSLWLEKLAMDSRT